MARDVITRQLLLSGRIADAISSARLLTTPALAVTDADRPARALGLLLRLLPDGLFSVSLDPRGSLPPAAVTLRLTVTAPGYQEAVADVALSAADLARVPGTVMVGGDSEPVTRLASAPVVQDIFLMPQPVTLAGRIVAADDPAVPIAGASVRVTAPSQMGPALTDAAGYFTLPSVPVAAELTLEISAPGRQAATPTVPLDYRTPTNRREFALEQI